MMQRHDYVTPYINGVRFFDKPPLLYWMTLPVHLFLIALDRVQAKAPPQNRMPHVRRSLIAANVGDRDSDPLSSPSHQTSGAPSFAPFANRGPRQLRWWGRKGGDVK